MGVEVRPAVKQPLLEGRIWIHFVVVPYRER
jgi:hypothetical protein